MTTIQYNYRTIITKTNAITLMNSGNKTLNSEIQFKKKCIFGFMNFL